MGVSMTHWVKPLGAAALALGLGGALWGCAEERPSLLGETCARTAHCEQPLRCVDAVCVTEVRARRLLATRRVSEPSSGDPNPAADLVPAAERIRPAAVPDGVQRRPVTRPTPAADRRPAATTPTPTAADNPSAPAAALPMDAPAGNPPGPDGPPPDTPPAGEPLGAPPVDVDAPVVPAAGPGGQ